MEGFVLLGKIGEKKKAFLLTQKYLKSRIHCFVLRCISKYLILYWAEYFFFFRLIKAKQK